MAKMPPQFKKFTESKDKSADRRAGIKEGTKRDTALDRRRGLPPDKVGAGHMANARNPLGAGQAGKWTEAKDKASDRRAGIKEGSARDNALDRKRGLPIDKKVGAGNSGKSKNGARC